MVSPPPFSLSSNRRAGISELCIQFQQNINEDKTSREFTKEELAGLPDDFLENLNKSEDGQK